MVESVLLLVGQWMDVDGDVFWRLVKFDFGGLVFTGLIKMTGIKRIKQNSEFIFVLVHYGLTFLFVLLGAKLTNNFSSAEPKNCPC